MTQENDEEKIVNPIDRSADTSEKIRQLQELSKQNETSELRQSLAGLS